MLSFFYIYLLTTPLSTVNSASQDNIRLWNITELESKSSLRPFQIIAGHHGGLISNIRKFTHRKRK
jgi:hypothetical protein